MPTDSVERQPEGWAYREVDEDGTPLTNWKCSTIEPAATGFVEEHQRRRQVVRLAPANLGLAPDTAPSSVPDAELWRAIERAYRHGYCAGHLDADADGFRPDYKASRYMDSPPYATREAVAAALRTTQPHTEPDAATGAEGDPQGATFEGLAVTLEQRILAHRQMFRAEPTMPLPVDLAERIAAALRTPSTGTAGLRKWNPTPTIDRLTRERAEDEAESGDADGEALACEKCGSRDINTRYVPAGGKIEPYASQDSPWRWKDAVAECLFRNCRTCGWRWVDPVRSAPDSLPEQDRGEASGG